MYFFRLIASSVIAEAIPEMQTIACGGSAVIALPELRSRTPNFIRAGAEATGIQGIAVPLEGDLEKVRSPDRCVWACSPVRSRTT